VLAEVAIVTAAAISSKVRSLDEARPLAKHRAQRAGRCGWVSGAGLTRCLRPQVAAGGTCMAARARAWSVCTAASMECRRPAWTHSWQCAVVHEVLERSDASFVRLSLRSLPLSAASLHAMPTRCDPQGHTLLLSSCSAIWHHRRRPRSQLLAYFSARLHRQRALPAAKQSSRRREAPNRMQPNCARAHTSSDRLSLRESHSRRSHHKRDF
jgi:hypothetical protein